jgi:anti-sigma regulatory factor (Ser/Thr protein kinase)
MMTGSETEKTEERLTLRGRLSEMARLPAWIERLASRHGIPDKVSFAIDLCLEEALSNIILHGYGGETDRSVIVRFTTPREGYFDFVVDDEAPRFNPLDQPEIPPLDPRDDIRIGGQGIRLLRRFADELEYEPTPTGNRLRLGFSIDGSAVRAE